MASEAMGLIPGHPQTWNRSVRLPGSGL